MVTHKITFSYIFLPLRAMQNITTTSFTHFTVSKTGSSPVCPNQTLSDTFSQGKKINFQTRISCGEKQGHPVTKSGHITISIKSAAQDGTVFKASTYVFTVNEYS